MGTLLPAPERSSLPEAELEDYDAMTGWLALLDGGDRADYPGSEVFRAMLHSPPVARAVRDLGAAILGGAGGRVPPQFHQFADIVISLELHSTRPRDGSGCELRVLFNHLPEAVRVGVRPAAIRALLDANEAELTEEEALCAVFVRGVLHGNLSDETRGAMEVRLGRRGALEYALLSLLVSYMTRVEDFVGCGAPTMADVEKRLAELWS